jgi:hypothetical protein
VPITAPELLPLQKVICCFQVWTLCHAKLIYSLREKVKFLVYFNLRYAFFLKNTCELQYVLLTQVKAAVATLSVSTIEQSQRLNVIYRAPNYLHTDLQVRYIGLEAELERAHRLVWHHVLM